MCADIAALLQVILGMCARQWWRMLNIPVRVAEGLRPLEAQFANPSQFGKVSHINYIGIGKIS